jgi:hypothetical protein
MPEPVRAARSVSPEPESLSKIRDSIARIFGRVEDVVYIGLGGLLAASALVLLGTAIVAFGRQVASGDMPGGIVALLDQILLVMMIVEILYTVQVSFREHTLAPEPFLIVGLIAATRRVLVLTAEFAELMDRGGDAFRNAMIELGLLTVMILVLVISLALLRRHGPRPAERA